MELYWLLYGIVEFVDDGCMVGVVGDCVGCGDGVGMEFVEFCIAAMIALVMESLIVLVIVDIDDCIVLTCSATVFSL